MSTLFLAGTLCAVTLLPAVASAYDFTPRASSPEPSAPAAPPVPDLRPAPGADSRRATSLDIDLSLHGRGFKFGGRLSSDKGVSGAWVGGHVREDGLTLDGQIQSDDGRSRAGDGPVGEGGDLALPRPAPRRRSCHGDELVEVFDDERGRL